MKILLLDIETAPNTMFTWGMFNQNISLNQIVQPGYTLCWAAKWLGREEVMFNSIHATNNTQMVAEMWSLLNEADAVIHYNGTRFDIPTLNKEFLLLGMRPPEPYKQIDLLHTVRRKFRLTSNKLDYVVQQLGLGAKVEHKGMELWKDCMAGDDEAWYTMEEYNKRDVTLLEDLYRYLLPWIEKHPNYGLYVKTDRPVCPHCGSSHLHSRGTQHNTYTQSYKRFQCNDCGTWVRERFSSVSKEKRQHILTEAV